MSPLEFGIVRVRTSQYRIEYKLYFTRDKRINRKSYLTYGPRTIFIFTGMGGIRDCGYLHLGGGWLECNAMLCRISGRRRRQHLLKHLLPHKLFCLILPPQLCSSHYWGPQKQCSRATNVVGGFVSPNLDVGFLNNY
jgi:hypothetical protein